MAEQLKPCPFCGKPPRAVLRKHCGTIACETTDCAYVEVERGQSTEAVRVWNRRAPALPAIVAALEAALDSHTRLNLLNVAEFVESRPFAAGHATGLAKAIDIVKEHNK